MSFYRLASTYNNSAGSAHQEDNDTRNSGSTTINDACTISDGAQDVAGAITPGSQATVVEPYRPPILLLLISIALVVSMTVGCILEYDKDFIFLSTLPLLQSCVLIAIPQLYGIIQIVRQRTHDFNRESNYTFDVTIIWLSTSVMTIAVTLAEREYFGEYLRYLISAIAAETGLLLCFSASICFQSYQD